MNNDFIYLDNSATTKMDENVITQINYTNNHFYGNPSCEYNLGIKSNLLVNEHRHYISSMLKSDPSNIYFTSGATESNNWVIKGIIDKYINEDIHIITSKIEHPSILNTLKYYEKILNTLEITYLDVDEKGVINPVELRSKIKKNTKLISIMWVNNETGVIQPIEELSVRTSLMNSYFHTDATQALGKLSIDVEPCIDFLSISAHKVYGPKGVGALYIRNGNTIPPLLHGGGQEDKLRAGTENVSGIVGFGEACCVLKEQQIMNTIYIDRLSKLLYYYLKGLNEKYNCLEFNSDCTKNYVPHIINFSLLNGYNSKECLEYLSDRNIYCSSGSACSCKEKKPSHVILALGKPEELALSTIRISLGKYNTVTEIEKFLETFESYLKGKKK